MSLLNDVKHVPDIAHLVRNFRHKTGYIWNFSCPICGDSKKSKSKARGFITRLKDNGDGLGYKCHNCGCSIHFSDLLKTLDPDLYKQYQYDSILDRTDSERIEKAIAKPYKPLRPPSFLKPTVLSGCPSIQSLNSDHPAKSYLTQRKLPNELFSQLYWTDDFQAVAKVVSGDENLKLAREGRIIIPCLSENNELMAIQGRTIDPKHTLRYITIKTSEESPKIYGMHRLTKSRRIYVVEGPFDSMFLPNCLAMAGSDIPKSIHDPVIIYDNEPRSITTCTKIQKAIEDGYKVVIWPDEIVEKDINKMVENGYNPDKIRSIVDRNIYSGIKASEHFRTWKKR